MIQAQFSEVTGFPVNFPTQKGIISVFEKKVADLITYETDLANSLVAIIGEGTTFTFYNEADLPAERAYFVKNNDNGKIVYFPKRLTDNIGVAGWPALDYATNYYAHLLK